MKKYLCICLFLLSLSSFSQDRFSYGFQFGVNSSSLKLSGLVWDDFLSSRQGILFGANAEFNLNRKFSVVGNLNYEEKGGKYHLGNYGGEGTLKLNYLTLPLLLRFKMGKGSVKFFVNAGLFGGYLIHSENPDPDDFTNLKNWDMGYAIGLGITTAINNHNNIFIEGRLNSGGKGVAKMSIYDRWLKNGNISLVLGYTFN